MKNNLRTLVMTAAVAFFAFSCQKNDDATPPILEAEVDEVVDIVAEELFQTMCWAAQKTFHLGWKPMLLITAHGTDLTVNRNFPSGILAAA